MIVKKVCFCGNPKCKPRIARIRENKLWVKIGIYHTGCRGFSPLSRDQTQNIEQYPQENIADFLHSADESFSNSECIHHDGSFTTILGTIMVVVSFILQKIHSLFWLILCSMSPLP